MLITYYSRQVSAIIFNESVNLDKVIQNCRKHHHLITLSALMLRGNIENWADKLATVLLDLRASLRDNTGVSAALGFWCILKATGRVF